MASVSSAAGSKLLTSTITVTGVYSYGTLVGYDRSSNTATGSLSFSVSGIPAGSSINSCTLYFTYDGITSYGGSGKVNSIEYTSGSYSQNLGAVTSATVNFSYKSNANDGGTSTNPKSTVSQTVDWTNVYITVDYTAPSAATVSNVRLDTSASNIYKAAGASATLSWDAANGTNNAISSYSIYYRDNGGAWAAYATGVTAKSYTVASHGTAGSNRQFYVVAIAPYGNSGNVTSPIVYSYSAVSTPTGVGISPASVFPGASVTLSWTASSGGVGTSVTGYQVLENGAVKTTVTGISYSFSAPAQGSYTYKVVAVANVSGYNSAQSAGAALTVSPPASSFVLDKSTVAMDGAATIKATISPVNPAYNHDVTFALDATRTSTANVAAGSTTRTYTVPLAWCAGVTSSTSATATCTVVTKNGTTVVGQTSLTFTVTVPASVVPTVSLTVAAVDGFNGLYLKGRSKCRMTAAGTGVQGSTIVSRSLSGGGYSGSASPYTTGVLNTIDSIAMSAFVTDSRSRQSATSTQNITVLDYGSPVISAVTAFRSDSSGNALDLGAYIAVKASLTVSTVTGNSGTATVRKRITGGTWEAATSITHNTTKILSGALVANAYEVEITLTDTVGSVATYSTTVKPSSFMFDFRMDRAGIGRLASTTKQLMLPDDWTTNVNADKLDGFHVNYVGGTTWGYIPVVSGDGVTEIGRYLDFHHESNNGHDYDVRLCTDGTTAGKLLIGSQEIMHAGNIGFLVTHAFHNALDQSVYCVSYDYNTLLITMPYVSGTQYIFYYVEINGNSYNEGVAPYNTRIQAYRYETSFLSTYQRNHGATMSAGVWMEYNGYQRLVIDGLPIYSHPIVKVWASYANYFVSNFSLSLVASVPSGTIQATCSIV